MAGKGSGFCILTTAAVAARLIQAENLSSAGRSIKEDFRVAIVDLDVHQGNGTASILCDDPSVFTLSLHGEKNFPFRKETSNLDVGLPDAPATRNISLRSTVRLTNCSSVFRRT